MELNVIPAKAGQEVKLSCAIHEVKTSDWIPAVAGTTLRDLPNANRSFWVHVSEDALGQVYFKTNVGNGAKEIQLS